MKNVERLKRVDVNLKNVKSATRVIACRKMNHAAVNANHQVNEVTTGS